MVPQMITDVYFDAQALADYQAWKTEDAKRFDRINRLIEDIISHPFTGLGKPEPLKHDLAGRWSRRITREHRLVYKVDGDTLQITACKDHY
jgi:toxin YoeB